MARFHSPLLLLGLPLIAVAGCAGHSGPTETPRTPSGNVIPIVAEDTTTRLAPILAGHVEFDVATMTATLTPYRAASAGSQDILETVDVGQFFTNAPCHDCLAITGVGLAPSGNPTLDISIKHPFASPAPTVAMNQDFSVFNVQAVVLFNDTGETVTDFPNLAQSVLTSKRLVNADGFTGYLDSAYDVDYFTTAATLHPYKLFYRDYSTGTFDGANPQGFPDYADVRGFLAMGQGKGPDVQTLEFSVPNRGAKLNFELIVEASFGNGASNRPEKNVPEYRCPQYNKKAASEIHVGISNASPTSFNGLGLLDSVTASAAQVRIQALDITDASSGVTVGANRDQIRAASDVGAIALEIPGVLSGLLNEPDPSSIFISGVGNNPANPLTYAQGITNESNADMGTYYGLVRVTDTYPLGSNAVFAADAYEFATPGFTAPHPITEIAAYALTPVVVAPNTVTLLGGSENGQLLGSSMTWGDFNNDNSLDLAVGAPETTAGLQSKAGKIFVYYGFANGDFAPPIYLQEFSPQLNVRLGFALAAGDIEGDGDDDLLASAINNISGRVIVYRSSGLGFLTGVTVQDAALTNGSRFGASIAVADLN
ncbi:MAG: integrin alpha, partial [bacterium]